MPGCQAPGHGLQRRVRGARSGRLRSATVGTHCRRGAPARPSTSARRASTRSRCPCAEEIAAVGALEPLVHLKATVVGSVRIVPGPLLAVDAAPGPLVRGVLSPRAMPDEPALPEIPEGGQPLGVGNSPLHEPGGCAPLAHDTLPVPGGGTVLADRLDEALDPRSRARFPCCPGQAGPDERERERAHEREQEPAHAVWFHVLPPFWALVPGPPLDAGRAPGGRLRDAAGRRRPRGRFFEAG
jgi:hypothetical protein